MTVVPLPTSAPARRLGIALSIVTFLVVTVFVVVFAVNKLVEIPAWKEFVDIGGEANLPTWWNTTLLVLVAAAAMVAAEGETRVDRRRSWWVIAAAGAYLSIDEASSLHERLAGPVDDAGVDLPTYAWLLPGVVLASVGVAVLVTVGRKLPAPTARALLVALGLYGLGAIGMEALTGFIFEQGEGSIAFSIGITIEESLEMFACVLAVVTIVDARRFDDR